jgi:broad specificity phosphatase PhoE
MTIHIMQPNVHPLYLIARSPLFGSRAAALAVLLAAMLCTASLHAQEQYPMMFFVRHAEKAEKGVSDMSDKGNNPPLTQAGRERAQLLAKTVVRMVAEENGAPLTAIYVTEYERTQQTAQPLAEATGLTPIVINASDAAELIKELRTSPRSCLVVGHSNTIPDIVQQLSGEPVPPIEDNEYNRLFVLTMQGKKKLLNFQTFGLPPPRKKKDNENKGNESKEHQK